MAESELTVVRGTPVTVELRNIGWVEGTVAWVQEHRFGIAFVDEIDPKAPRTRWATVTLRPRDSYVPPESPRWAPTAKARKSARSDTAR